MTRLTEEMVVARTRCFDITSLTRLNLWGSDLSDVSLLRKMWSVEIISLSINKISSLVDMQYCRNLKELYLRKNNIKDLNQICYLQELPRLKNLWLEDNPICTIDHYRMTVLRALPRLEKLDNQLVLPEDLEEARRLGRELVHPEATATGGSGGSPSPSNRSPVQSPSRSQEELRSSRRVEEEYYDESEDESASRLSSTQQQLQNYKPVVDGMRPVNAVRHGESCPEQLMSARQQEEGFHHPQHAEDNRNANYHEESVGYPRSQSHHNYNHFDRPNMVNGESTSSVSGQEHPIINKSQGDEDHDRSSERLTNQQLNEHPRIDINRRRPMTRNSNIISAVLCLIKELDIQNLEVVEMAVRNRIYELEEDNLS